MNATTQRVNLYLQLPKVTAIAAGYLPHTALFGASGVCYSGTHQLLLTGIGLYLIGSILLRNLFLVQRLNLTVLTAWVMIDTALSIVAWSVSGWQLSPVFASLITVGEAAIVGFSLWQGLAHFGLTAAMVAVAPMLNRATTQDYWQEYLLPIAPGLAFVYAFVYLAGTMRAEREAVVRARMEAELANVQLREYANQVEDLAVMRERNRLAREVHDTIAHGFTGIIMQVEGITRIWNSEPELAAEALAQVRDQARVSLSEVRRSVHALRPQQLEDRMGTAAMKKLAHEFGATTGVPTEFLVEGQPVELPAAHDLCLYRAVQEGLTNAFRHGHAERARVRLTFTSEQVSLTVEDDGYGATGDVTRGLGLVGIRERVEVLGGTMEAATAPTGGFVLHLSLPLKHSQPGRSA